MDESGNEPRRPPLPEYTDGRNSTPKKKRRKSRRLSEADLGLFVKQYGRKAHPGHDPNDRHYSRDVEQKIKRMKPEEIDRLMRDEDT